MKYTLLTLLLSTFLFAATGCKSSVETAQTQSPTETVTTTVTTATVTTTTQQTTTSQTKPTETTTSQTTSTETTTTQQTTTLQITSTETITIQETTTAVITETTTEDTEIEILEFISIEMYGYLVEDLKIFDGTQHITYKNHAYYLKDKAEPYSDSLYGQITCEEDVIKIAREIFAIECGDEFVEQIESEYIEIQGELVRYERDVPPYSVKYYKEYDVWYINPNAPSGVTEDGIKFGTPSMPPYLLIRGEDGKILGALI